MASAPGGVSGFDCGGIEVDDDRPVVGQAVVFGDTIPGQSGGKRLGQKRPVDSTATTPATGTLGPVDVTVTTAVMM